MLLPNVYFVPLKPVDKKPLIVTFSEFCSKYDPKPFYCEFPDDIKTKSEASGTLETYSVASTATVSNVGTTTTTL